MFLLAESGVAGAEQGLSKTFDFILSTTLLGLLKSSAPKSLSWELVDIFLLVGVEAPEEIDDPRSDSSFVKIEDCW